MSLCFWFGIYLNSPRAKSGEAQAMFAKIKAWVVKGGMGRGLAG
jgi:hypothetical protein